MFKILAQAAITIIVIELERAALRIIERLLSAIHEYAH